MQGLRAEDRKKKYEKICNSKVQLTIGDLCAGLPAELAEYFTIVRALAFDEAPNYSHARRLFRSLFVRKGYAWDYNYDWKLRVAAEASFASAAAGQPPPTITPTVMPPVSARPAPGPTPRARLPPMVQPKPGVSKGVAASPETTLEVELRTTQKPDDDSAQMQKATLKTRARAFFRKR